MTGNSQLRVIEYSCELVKRDDLNIVPRNTRGLYVLYKAVRPQPGGKRHFDVVYIGLAAGPRTGIAARLYSHNRQKRDWSHFSVFSVWPNIRDEEVRELEGLLRHIFQFDTRANRLAIAKGYNPLGAVRRSSKAEGWMQGARSDYPRRPRVVRTTQ